MTFKDVLIVILSILGNIISTGTAVSGLPKFLEIDKNRDVGPMNIYPIIALCVNSLCWVVYGVIISNMSILPVNVIGLIVTSYFTVVYISAVSNLNQRRFISAIFFGLHSAVIIYSILIILYVKQSSQASIFGYTCNISVLIFYGSPIFSLYGVIRTRNTSTINLPLVTVSCLAAIIWTIFGVLKGDKFIYTPNAVGATLSAISMLAYFAIGYLNSITQYKNNNDDTPDGATSRQDIALIINSENNKSSEFETNEIDLDYEDNKI